jgi:hypothetical protein
MGCRDVIYNVSQGLPKKNEPVKIYETHQFDKKPDF